MNRLGCVILLTLLGASWLQADITPDAPSAATPQPQTNPALVAEHYRQVLARPEYTEEREPDVNSRLKEWLSVWFMRLGSQFGEFKYASRMPAFESMLMTVLAALSIAALLYTMARLTRRRARIDPESPRSAPGPKVFHPPETYDDEIEQAIRSGNWHAAWLATWRQFLSRLENRQLAETDRTRTNREYLAQLTAKAIPLPAANLLTSMVDAYDQYIYGRRKIDETDWNHFHQQISETGLLLHLDNKGISTKAEGA